jgi:hypothetical protein
MNGPSNVWKIGTDLPFAAAQKHGRVGYAVGAVGDRANDI